MSLRGLFETFLYLFVYVVTLCLMYVVSLELCWW
jgi:hypothetical protein